MNRRPSLRLVPIDALRPHEEIDPAKVDEIVEEIRATGTVDVPIWVAAESCVILNGHHRVAALKQLGAERVPAYVLEYRSSAVRLGRWNSGPALTKAEVEDRARRGALFPPKTTRHSIELELPPRPTPLRQLLGGAGHRRRPAQRRASAPSRPGRAAGSDAP